jgi:hypothetical protein
VTTLITSLRQFSEVLIQTGEIDPSYYMLYSARRYSSYGEEWVKRFCVAYLLFYHTGTAAKAADCEGADFWRCLKDAWENTRSRGPERRHFRGDKSWEALKFCSQYHPNKPEDMFDYPRPASNYRRFHAAASKYPQFGNYFIWKWNDFSTCVFDDVRTLADCESYLPDVPKKALQRVWPDRHWQNSFEYLTDLISDIPEPFCITPRRMCGPQEAETIACSIKGYVLQHPQTYIGYDIHEKHAQLEKLMGENSWLSKLLPEHIDPSEYKVDKNAVLDSARISA